MVNRQSVRPISRKKSDWKTDATAKIDTQDNFIPPPPAQAQLNTTGANNKDTGKYNNTNLDSFFLAGSAASMRTLHRVHGPSVFISYRRAQSRDYTGIMWYYYYFFFILIIALSMILNIVIILPSRVVVVDVLIDIPVLVADVVVGLIAVVKNCRDDGFCDSRPPIIPSHRLTDRVRTPHRNNDENHAILFFIEIYLLCPERSFHLENST